MKSIKWKCPLCNKKLPRRQEDYHPLLDCEDCKLSIRYDEMKKPFSFVIFLENYRIWSCLQYPRTFVIDYNTNSHYNFAATLNYSITKDKLERFLLLI